MLLFNLEVETKENVVAESPSRSHLAIHLQCAKMMGLRQIWSKQYVGVMAFPAVEWCLAGARDLMVFCA